MVSYEEDAALWSLDLFCQCIKEDYPTIDEGGCCVFAVLIAPHLLKLGEVRIRASVSTRWHGIPPGDIDQARERVRVNSVDEWSDAGIHFSHVFIELTRNGRCYFVDTSGVSPATDRDPTFDEPIHGGELDIDDARELADDAHGWNHSFDRNLIPKLEQDVEDMFTTWEYA